jgi:predicted nucleic acid-binding Zn ribbon protein
MAMLSIGDSLNSFLKSAKWQAKINEIRIKTEWEKIMGATIARYTREVKLKDGILIIASDVAPLKQELQFGKEQIIRNVNEYFKDNVVKEVVIK